MTSINNGIARGALFLPLTNETHNRTVVSHAMKTLIVYYSFSHNNELLARTLQAELECAIYPIREVLKKRSWFTILLDLLFDRRPPIEAGECHVADYDCCLLVGPVWGGKVASPLKTFLLREKKNLTRYAFVTVCGGRNPAQAIQLRKELSTLTGKEPEGVCECWVSELLPADRKHAKDVSSYRIQEKDLMVFQGRVATFLQGLEKPRAVAWALNNRFISRI